MIYESESACSPLFTAPFTSIIDPIYPSLCQKAQTISNDGFFRTSSFTISISTVLNRNSATNFLHALVHLKLTLNPLNCYVNMLKIQFFKSHIHVATFLYKGKS